MIGFIVREIFGWALVALGLYVFYVSYALLRDGYMLRGPPIALIGFFIFRGGIHLLKVAVAARVSQKAQRELTDAARRPTLPGVPRKAA